MVYYKIDFKHSLISPELDLLLSDLGEIGFESFEQEKESLIGYIQQNVYDKLEATELPQLLSSYKGISIVAENIMPDINWNKEWESNYKAVQINNFCYVRAPFHPQIDEVKHDVIIEPKMSFGTAHHQTTALMITFISESEWVDKDVVDMGCGTGVLAILAKKEGSKSVLAIDYDTWACENARENVLRNNVSEITVSQGSKELLQENSADIILANINRNILLDHIETYARALKKDGILFLSGFYVSDIDILEKEAEKCGLLKLEQKENSNWSALKLCKRAFR